MSLFGMGPENEEWFAAAKNGDVEKLETLHSRIIKLINKQDKDGNTALHLAVTSFKLEAAKWLTEHEAKIKIKNKDNKTPLDLALQSGDRDLMNLLANSEMRDKFNKAMGSSAAANAMPFRM